MKRIRELVLTSCVGLMLVSMSALGVTALPFGDDFEQTIGSSLGTNWTVGAGIAQVSNSELVSGGGTASAYVSEDASLNLSDGIPDHTNVWWSGYAKVTPQDDSSEEPAISTNAAAFYVNTSNQVKAYSNGAWSVVATGVDPDAWIGFSAHLDFGADKWDLYKTASSFTYGDAMSKLNTAGALAFNAAHTATQLREFNVTGTTYIDGIAVSYDGLGTPVDGNTPDNAANASIDLYLNGNLTGLLAQYFSLADSTMNGPLGDALYGALADGDKVHIFVPQDTTDWQIFTHQGAGSGWSHSGGASNNPTVYQTTALWIELLGDANERDASMTISYTSLADPVDIAIAGKTEDGSGWTALAWPETFSKSFADHADMQLPSPVQGDRVYVWELQGHGSYGYTLLLWDATDNRWENAFGSAATTTLTHGKAFWYFRNTDSGGSWNADSIVE